MGVVSKTGAALVLLVALLLCFAGYASAQVPAQYGATTPADQHGTPLGGQYDSSAADTTSSREDQYTTAAPEEQPGGGTTTAPVRGNKDDGAAGIQLPKRQPSGAGNFSRLLDGFFSDAGKLLAALSLITTVVFFLERSRDRPG